MSEVFRRAVRYYIQENPDGFGAFTESSGPNVVQLDPESVTGADPVGTSEEPVTGSEGENAEGAGPEGVYDPTEDA